MEPLIALAVCGNLFQFLDAAGKLIAEARQIYHSASGITANNRNALAVCGDFQALATALASRSLGAPTTPDDVAIISLANRAQVITADLVQCLQGHAARNPKSYLLSMLAAWRSWRDRHHLELGEKQLDQIRQQLILRLNYMMSHQHSSTYQLLQECSRQIEDLGVQRRDDLEKLRQDILRLAQTVDQLSQAAISSTPQDAQDRIPNRIAELVSDIITTRTRWEKECRILDRLRFLGMRQRENAIEPAHAGTYRWLLYPANEHPRAETAHLNQQPSPKTEPIEPEDAFFETLQKIHEASVEFALSPRWEGEVRKLNAEAGARFIEWLEAGSGIFYISGKAGSGKSTAMKFLTREKRTIDALGSWAGGRRLAVASFFFWKQDLALQRSVEGLYRSLLWETLRVCPELIPTVFPSAWGCAPGGGLSQVPPSDPEFLLTELEEAFGRLVAIPDSLPNYRLCFFIDGLDEFEGDHGKLASLLRKWATSPDVKICLSSRPNSEVDTSLATQPQRCLCLQEHTKEDMFQVAQDELTRATEHVMSSSSRRLDDMVLIRSAVEKADGVFLWLRLVLRHLVRHLKSTSSIPQLMEMLHCMPAEMSVIFQLMLDKLLARPDRSRVAMTLLVLADPDFSSQEGQYVMRFAAMDDYLDGLIRDQDVLRVDGAALSKVYSAERIEKRLADAEARLRSRCEDFIDIHDNPNREGLPITQQRYVSLVHRDAREFLLQDHVNKKLREIAGYDEARLSEVSRMLTLVLLRTVSSTATRRGRLADEVIDDFLHSDSTSIKELAALAAIVVNQGAGFTSGQRLERYCSNLAVRDHTFPGRQITRAVAYDPSREEDRICQFVAFSSAAAFHRHDSYVLKVAKSSLFPYNPGLDGHFLLSASLGGAAALATFTYPIQKKKAMFPRSGHTNPFIESIAGCSLDSGGLGALLYPRVAFDLFPEAAGIDQAFDTNLFEADEHGRPAPEKRGVRRGGPDPLFLARTLLQKGISPNTRLLLYRPTTLPAWSGSYWTPWTTVLLNLTAVMRKGELLDDVFLDLAELYLRHGADPTVCFVGRYLPEDKVKKVPVWRAGPGVYLFIQQEAHVAELFTDEHANWHYLTLSQVVQLVRPRHPKQKTVQDLVDAGLPGRATSWWRRLASVASSWGWGYAGAKPPSSNGISRLDLERLGTCYFFVSMVVREDKLDKLVIPDWAGGILMALRPIPI